MVGIADEDKGVTGVDEGESGVTGPMGVGSGVDSQSGPVGVAYVEVETPPSIAGDVELELEAGVCERVGVGYARSGMDVLLNAVPGGGSVDELASEDTSTGLSGVEVGVGGVGGIGDDEGTSVSISESVGSVGVGMSVGATQSLSQTGTVGVGELLTSTQPVSVGEGGADDKSAMGVEDGVSSPGAVGVRNSDDSGVVGVGAGVQESVLNTADVWGVGVSLGDCHIQLDVLDGVSDGQYHGPVDVDS